MSNRDGRNGSKSDSHAPGSPCHNCKTKAKFKRRTEKTPKLPRLERACGNQEGHKHHVVCMSCKWTNF